MNDLAPGIFADLLPARPVSELRRLWLAACDAQEALSRECTHNFAELDDDGFGRLEDAQFATRQALLNHLLFEFGITKAEAERIGGVL